MSIHTSMGNPVLFEYRWDAKYNSHIVSARDALDACTREWWHVDEANDDEIEHARRVLTRLANFGQEPGEES